MTNDDVKTIYVLEMTDRDQFQPKPNAPAEFEVRRAEIPCPELNWFMHQAVGSDYRWGGRESRDADARRRRTVAVSGFETYAGGLTASQGVEAERPSFHVVLKLLC